MTITNRYTFANAVAPLLQKYVHLSHPVPSTKVQASTMTANTIMNDLTIYIRLIYRSMRYVTLGVTIMMVITLILSTID